MAWAYRRYFWAIVGRRGWDLAEVSLRNLSRQNPLPFLIDETFMINGLTW
jgi:hypothetical protein